ncbi:MAG TPA: RNA-binding cell elongation regulator Jag/EloR [Smithellaceae bacterium]|jgi:spoIIIJ-associated protein|nr:RNA-binding cell elongation regulator Jag/EloR [Smithellaceae bacterium]HPW23906.1 RNA-binding cell elongation regulator Jag/EloR [Smithellaceae bacterium]HQB93252.1 RNA-binding cell elongation regulator Jag/EloR [Smithellaceae bacterium]HQG22977.1 RNA-binding cell elongation regulator Jag/EloR [Smithellaceae bacterium]HQG95586.1 RNA-binding cell elongation regulator Jag/EloR [Smithellaceae bacterium]
MDAKIMEIEGKSIDEAIEKACREFGVAREKLNIEIISEETGGFLGMLSKKAKIKASLLSLDMEFSLADTSSEPQKEEVKTEIKEAKKEVKEIKRETKKEPAAKIKITAETSKPAPQEPTALGVRAKEILEGILQRMSLQCKVVLAETTDKIVLNIEGSDSGLLIGKRGQNLDALQYILNKAINKADNGRKIIMVDSEEYRRRREASLLDLAEKVRQKVKKTRKPVSLGHMSAHDRRIIHLALQEDASLTTKSRGEGEYRKIVVLPAKKGKAVHNGQQNPG